MFLGNCKMNAFESTFKKKCKSPAGNDKTEFELRMETGWVINNWWQNLNWFSSTVNLLYSSSGICFAWKGLYEIITFINFEWFIFFVTRCLVTADKAWKPAFLTACSAWVCWVMMTNIKVQHCSSQLTWQWLICLSDSAGDWNAKRRANMNVSDRGLMTPESIYSSEQAGKKWNAKRIGENPDCHSVG